MLRPVPLQILTTVLRTFAAQVIGDLPLPAVRELPVLTSKEVTVDGETVDLTIVAPRAESGGMVNEIAGS